MAWIKRNFSLTGWLLGRIVSWNVAVMILHQSGRPADANEKAVRAAYSYLIETPLTVTQDTSGTDDKVVDPCRNRINVGRSDEDSEWIVLLRHAPGALSGSREMYLTTPTRHDDVFVISASPGESKAFPERHCGTQVVTWNNGERSTVRGTAMGKLRLGRYLSSALKLS